MDYLFRDEEFMDPFAAVHKRSFDDDGDVEKASFKLVSGTFANKIAYLMTHYDVKYSIVCVCCVSW